MIRKHMTLLVAGVSILSGFAVAADLPDNRPRMVQAPPAPAAPAAVAQATVPAAAAATQAPQPNMPVSKERLEQAVAAAWKNLAPDMQARVDQDETMRDCSAYRNDVPAALAAQIMAREKKNLELPPDGKFMGDWKKGEKVALSGYGGRMKDNPAVANGGNCYACHQLAPAEISYGTLGPSLLHYGKTKGTSIEAQKEVYERIYNAQSVFACSNMPRFGTHKFLTIDQIKDAVAFLLDPESPVNK